MARQSDYFETFLGEEITHLVNRVVERVVDKLVERLSERFQRSERTEHAERSVSVHRLPLASPSVKSEPKATLLKRLRAMQAEGLSLQTIANRLNAEGIPTLSGKGRWQKGSIGNLLAQAGG